MVSVKQRKVISIILNSLLCLNIIYIFPVIKAEAIEYNPASAVEYAHKYAYSYNSKYSNYNSIGGDCANFVSQCLYAGGLEMTDGWYWYSYEGRSSSWASCPNMYNYFKNAGYTIIENPSNQELFPGNPVLYYSSSKGRWSHAAICVGYNDSGTPLVSAHNADHDSVDWRLGSGWAKRCTILINNGADPKPPPTPHPQISKDLYSADEIVEVTWNATENTTHYWLHTYKDGEDFENIDMYNNLSYARTYPAGNYTLYIASYNNSGETHDYVEFTVYDSVPKSPEPKIEKNLYSSNEAVTITWNDTANTTHYWLHTYKDGEDFENADMCNNLSYSRTYPAGNYMLYIASYNNYGETHDCVEFTVYNTVPENPEPYVEKKSYSINETVTITWNDTANTTHYWLHTYKDGEDFENADMCNNLSYSRTYPAGNYTLYIASYNNYGETHDCVEFTVYDTVPGKPDPKVIKDIYYSNETVEITWDEIANTDCYWLHIYRNGEEYINQTLNKDLSYSAKYPLGNYTAYIATCNGMGETVSNIKFSVIESGDVNADGQFTVADAVLLQKWLLAVPDTQLVNWKAADLCEDGRIDVFDLCLMKRMLVENS